MDEAEAELKKRLDEFDSSHSSIMYYDRDGKPISTYQFIRMLPSDKRVALTRVGKYRVSTVWLGIDHSFGFGGPPIIFETMIFWDSDVPRRVFGLEIPVEFDNYQDRYCTEEEALKGHAQAVEMVRLVMSALDDNVEVEDIVEDE